VSPTQLAQAAVAAALILAIALGSYWVVRLRGDARGESPDSPDDLLADLKAGFEAGHMSEAEYQRIRASLERRGALPPDRWAVPPRPPRPAPADAGPPRAADEPGPEPPATA
jgi:hypothetical protein